MQYRVVFFLLCPVLLISAAVLSLPVIYGIATGAEVWYVFPVPAALLVLGIAAWKGSRNHSRQLDIRAGAVSMFCAWLIVTLAGAVPYGTGGYMLWMDAWFQAASAAATTGIVSRHIYYALPPVLLMWHSVLGWLGGLQFLAFAVTIIPLVNVSETMAVQGRQNVSFSPMVHPMTGRAGKAAAIYCAYTMLAIGAYGLAGQTFFSAHSIRQALLIVSTTGGVGAAFPDTFAAQGIGCVLMFLACGNFLLYLKAWERRSVRVITQDAEWKCMAAIVVVCTALVSFHIWHGQMGTGANNIMQGMQYVLSSISTTGCMTNSPAVLPEWDVYILFLLAFCGASMASLSGGLRVMRLIILGKMAKNELNRAIHPHMVITFAVNGQTVAVRIVHYVLAYFFLFTATFFVSAMVVSLAGVTPLQALGMSLGCLSSAGEAVVLPGTMDVMYLPAWLKGYCTFLMIFGRMEIFSFLILVKTMLQLLRHPW